MLKTYFSVVRKSFNFDGVLFCSTCLIRSEETMGRLLKKIRKLVNRGNRSNRSRDATAKDCANCSSLKAKVDGKLFLIYISLEKF